MELTKEQMEYVMNHQKSPENVREVAEVLRKLAERYPNNEELHVTPEELKNMLLIANIGEHHPDMFIDGVSIYSKEFGKWDDSERGKQAKALNAQRGSKSVQMAQELGIELTPEMVEAIEATSQGKSVNLMAVLMKAAQTYEAVKHPRWSRGEKKEPAQSFEEVEEILREEMEFMMRGQEIEPEAKDQLVNGIIESARTTYSMEKITEQGMSKAWSGYKALQDQFLNYEPLEQQPMETKEFWNEFLSSLSPNQVRGFENELTRISQEQEKDALDELFALQSLVKSYEQSKLRNQLYEKNKAEQENNKPISKDNLSEVIGEATSEIQPDEAMGLLDDMINSKNKNRGPENP